MPDKQEREKILKIHAKNVKISETANLETVARSTVGCSGADLANLVNEAALYAARKSHATVEPEDFEEARDKILMGAARKSKVISVEEKLRTARHEAGHAILHLLLKHADPLHKVTIIPRGRALGLAFSLPENDMYGANKSYLIDRISICYGGYIAEKMYYDETSTGVENDLQQATQIASKMVKDWGMSDLGPVSYSDKSAATIFPFDTNRNSDYSDGTVNSIDNSIKAILKKGYEDAESLLKKNKNKLELLTAELIKHETLHGEQVHVLLGIKMKRSNEVKAEKSKNNDTVSVDESFVPVDSKVEKNKERRKSSIHEESPVSPTVT